MDGLASAGRLGLLQLYEYVAARVLESARSFNEVQTPTIYGSIEGAPTFAVLQPGVKYAQAFPDRVRLRAISDWASLARIVHEARWRVLLWQRVIGIRDAVSAMREMLVVDPGQGVRWRAGLGRRSGSVWASAT